MFVPQRLAGVEAALSSCQSELSARDSKLTKLRALLSRLTKQSDEQQSRLAAHNSERDVFLRCVANYRLLMTQPWSTVAACTLTASSASSVSSPVQPQPLVSALSSSAPSMVSSSLLAALAPSVSENHSDVDSARAAHPSVLPSMPDPLDDAVDVDECQPVLRVTLSDCTHWLLLSTRRDSHVLTAAAIAVQRQHQQQYDELYEQHDEGSEGQMQEGARWPVTVHAASPLTSTPRHFSRTPFASSDSDAAKDASLLSATAADLSGAELSSTRCLFWSELSVYLAYKWKKYQAAASSHHAQQYVPFAVLHSPSSTAISVAAAPPILNSSSPLASFIALLSSSASLSCSLALFDGACVPADCVTLVSNSMSTLHSSVVSRLRASHHQTVSGMSSAARKAEQSHESVVRDFSRYQQRTRELLAQKQRQLDEMLSRDDEAEGLRLSLAALSSQLDATNRDKSSQASSLVSLAQQLQACQADKERALLSERTVTAALLALQVDMRTLKETTEAKLALEQQRVQQADDAAQRMAWQVDDINRREAAAAAAATQHHATIERDADSAALPTEPYSRDNAAAEVDEQLDSASHMSAGIGTSASLPLTVNVPDSPHLSFGASAVDGYSATEASTGSSSGELASVRARVRTLQSLVQEREIALVQLQSALDASTGRCRSLESDLSLLRSMAAGSDNIEYLRNVLSRFLATDDDSLIPVLCTLLNVDKQQQNSIAAQRAKQPHLHSHSHSHQTAAAASQPPSFFSFF